MADDEHGEAHVGHHHPQDEVFRVVHVRAPIRSDGAKGRTEGDGAEQDQTDAVAAERPVERTHDQRRYEPAEPPGRAHDPRDGSDLHFGNDLGNQREAGSGR